MNHTLHSWGLGKWETADSCVPSRYLDCLGVGYEGHQTHGCKSLPILLPILQLAVFYAPHPSNDSGLNSLCTQVQSAGAQYDSFSANQSTWNEVFSSGPVSQLPIGSIITCPTLASSWTSQILVRQRTSHACASNGNPMHVLPGLFKNISWAG